MCSVLDVPPQPAAPAFQDDEDIYAIVLQVSIMARVDVASPILRELVYQWLHDPEGDFMQGAMNPPFQAKPWM